MKRGQTGIGLVILGVVAIIAVIGLVLLFTRASREGALLTDLSIGNTYQTVNPDVDSGISQVYVTPSGPRAPQVVYPAGPGYYPSAVQTKGSRTPSFIVSGRYTTGGFASIEDLYACERDLMTGPKIGVPHDMFNCYSVPNKGSTGAEVEGNFPGDSAAQARPPLEGVGKLGGDMYCYANSLGAEQQVPNSEDLIRENVLTTLVDNKSGNERFDWSSVLVNGVRVPVCWASAKTFPFDQGQKGN